MKLSQKDLDSVIIKKLERLDPLVDNFTPGEKGAFVSYDGQNFNLRKVNNLTLNKITSVSEIEALNAQLYDESILVKSSIFTNFNMNNRANTNFRTQIVELTGNTAFKTDNEIRLIKKGKTYILILDRKGIFYKYNLEKKEIDFKLDIADKVKHLFAVTNFQPYDILDFDIFRGGFLFSTKNNGVFFADIEGNNLEVLFPERDIVLVKDINEKDIILIDTHGVVTIYDFDQELKLETFNILKKVDQTIKAITICDDEIILLSSHKYKTSTENIIHILKKDLVGIGYNNITANVYPGTDVFGYIPSFIDADDKYIYVSGLKENKELFVWKYNRKELYKEYKEIIFNKLPITGLNFIKFENSKIYINCQDKLLVIDEDGNIKSNIKLGFDKIQDIIFENNKAFIFSGSELSWYIIPNYIFENEFNAILYDGEPCNSIDIFVKGNTGNELIMLLDSETLEQIQPTYYATYKGNSYIKILGKTIKSLTAKITVFEDTVIEGIVVKADRIFVK